jgi:hypothetical protein
MKPGLGRAKLKMKFGRILYPLPEGFPAGAIVFRCQIGLQYVDKLYQPDTDWKGLLRLARRDKPPMIAALKAVGHPID